MGRNIRRKMIYELMIEEDVLSKRECQDKEKDSSVFLL